MTLADITGTCQWVRIPRIAHDKLRFLWLTDYREGPRSGMIVYRGEVCAYELVSDHGDEPRRFAVLRLSPKQSEVEMEQHRQWQQRVGKGRPWDWWIKAYRQRTRPDYSACEVIGWFEC